MSQPARRQATLTGISPIRSVLTSADVVRRTIVDPSPPASTVTGVALRLDLAEEREVGPRYCETDLPSEVLAPRRRETRRGLPNATADQSGVIRVAKSASKRTSSSLTARPVMLIQVGASPSELRLGRMQIPVLEVRYSLPALTRMRVTRPQLIVVGESVSKDLIPLLRTQARAIGADVLELHKFVPAEAVGPWIKDTLARIANRQRAAGLKAALPSVSVA